MKSKKQDILKNTEKLRRNPFSVPEGYFDNLSTKVMDRIEEEQEKHVPTRNLWYTLRSQIALAASIIGFAMVSYIAVKIILSNHKAIEPDYIDIALLDKMDVLQDDTYLIDFFPLEEDEYTDEDIWMDKAVEYLASSDIEIDLLLEEN